MNIPWVGFMVFLVIIIILQEIRVIQLGSKIKTLEHYIDMYKNMKEREILKKDKAENGNQS